MRPDPRVWRGQWVVDLRPEFGGRYVLGPEALAREEALQLAWEKLTQLRGGRLGEVRQVDLFASAAPEGFAAALDAWERTKRYDTDGGAAYGRKYAKAVRRELGARQLVDFAAPHGAARIDAYVRDLEGRDQGPITIRNRVSVLRQVLRHAVQQGWLAQEPPKVRLPPRQSPVFDWVSEAMFRQLRAALFPPPALRALAGQLQRLGEPVATWVERRRVFLSWLFYTGVHTKDANGVTADDLFIDAQMYIRHNSKSAKHVEPEQFEMPDQLHADLMALQALLGRPFYPGEKFAGGPWPHVSAVMQRAAKQLGFPGGANPRIMRRSYAREMFLRGYEVFEVADRMGHVDEKMLRWIYVRTPRPAGRAKSRWTQAAVSPQPGTPSGMARVLQLRRPGGES